MSALMGTRHRVLSFVDGVSKDKYWAPKNYLHSSSHPICQLNHWKIEARCDVLSENPAQELAARLHTGTSLPCDILCPEDRVHASFLLLFLPLQTSQTAVAFSCRTWRPRLTLTATTAATTTTGTATPASTQVWVQVAVWHGRCGGDYQGLQGRDFSFQAVHLSKRHFNKSQCSLKGKFAKLKWPFD